MSHGGAPRAIIAAALLAVLASLVPGVTADATTVGWYNAAWAYRKAIVLNHTRIGSADATRFPVQINLDADADVASHARADRRDVVFTAADGVTRLNAEVAAPTANSVVTENGSWCWFQDPRAVHYVGAHDRTYVGWVNNVGDIVMYQYDTATHQSSTSTLHAALNNDDHAAPAILVQPDGRLMVFYSGHAGAAMYYRISTDPESIASWQPEKAVPTNTSGVNGGFTYANPVMLSGEGNKIYNFWRGGNFEPTYSTTTDLGSTWAPARTLFAASPSQRPYLKVASDDRSRIDFVVTDGNPAETTTSLYYFSYHDGAFYKADGTFIKTADATPLTPAMVDTVYNAVAHGKVNAWDWDIAIDRTGHPVIVYATLPNQTAHRYHYARWNGASWTDTEMTVGGASIGLDNYSPGITLDHDNPAVVYLSRQIGTHDEIERWTTADGGTSWTSIAITSGSTQQNVRPVVPRHHDTSMQVIWMYGWYGFYTSVQTGLKVFPPLAGSGQTTGEADVQIPTMSSTVDTTIYMYYGNPQAPPQPASSAAWGSTYRLVEHMADIAMTAGAVPDSSVTANTGTKQGADQSLETVGLAGKAQYFDGTFDLVRQSGPVNMAGWAGLTIEAWIKFERSAATHAATIVSNLPQPPVPSGQAGVQLGITFPAGVLQGYVTTAAGKLVGGTFPDLTIDGNWHEIALTYDPYFGLRGYLDGKVSATRFLSSATLAATASAPLLVGGSGSSASDHYRGWIDDLRVSSTKRDPAWLLANVTDVLRPAQFYTIGSEQHLQ